MNVSLNGTERGFDGLSVDELLELQHSYAREAAEVRERDGLYAMLDTAAGRKALQVPDALIRARILELTPPDQVITLGDD